MGRKLYDSNVQISAVSQELLEMITAEFVGKVAAGSVMDMYIYADEGYVYESVDSEILFSPMAGWSAGSVGVQMIYIGDEASFPVCQISNDVLGTNIYYQQGDTDNSILPQGDAFRETQKSLKIDWNSPLLVRYFNSSDVEVDFDTLLLKRVRLLVKKIKVATS